jgi:hypothetical protein
MYGHLRVLSDSDSPEPPQHHFFMLYHLREHPFFTLIVSNLFRCNRMQNESKAVVSNAAIMYKKH